MPIVADTNLTSGEVSPSFLGRADQQRFPNAAQRIENFLLTITGMRSKRPGMGLMGFPKGTSDPIRLRRFQFSDESGNMLELGHLYLRVWASNGQVIDGGVPVEVVTPFPSDRLNDIGFTQSADFLFAIDEEQGIFAIKKHDAVTWECVSYELKSGPYGVQNADEALTLAVSANGLKNTTTTITAAGFAVGAEPFGPGDEGRPIRLLSPVAGVDGIADWRWLTIDTIVDSTHVSATWQQDGTPFVVDTPYFEYRLGLFSDRLGWPKCGKIHEQRLVLAGAKSAPDRLDGSAIADFPNFAPTDPLVDNGAWGFALGTEDVNRIVALAPNNDLVVLTVGREHHIAGDATGAPITPSQVWQRPISADGARAIEPIAAGITTAFIDKYGMNIKAATWDLRFQNYMPDNLTKLSDHMYFQDPASAGFTALAWQANPIPTIWTVRGNGQLAGAVFEARENVLGWHRHPMGRLRTASGPLDQAIVESIDVLHGPFYDELWAAVLRVKDDGTPMRTIERMERAALWDYPLERQNYLDCSLTLFNSPAHDLTVPATSGTHVLVTASGADFTGKVGQFIKSRYRKAMPEDEVPGYMLSGRSRWRTAIALITEIGADPQTAYVDIAAPFPRAGTYKAGSWGLTVSQVSGLDHFNGYYVSALIDGKVQAPKLVTGGVLVLDMPACEIIAGLNYTAIVAMMPLDPGPQPAIGQGRQSRVDSVIVRFLNSVGGEFCSVPETDEEAPRWERMVAYQQGQGGASQPPVPTSADRKINLAGEWGRRTTIAARQRDPLPLNVLMESNHLYAPFMQP